MMESIPSSKDRPAAHSQAVVQGRLDAERAHAMSTGVGERDPADMIESIPSSKDRGREGADPAGSALTSSSAGTP